MQFSELFQGYTRAHGRYRVSGASDARGKVSGKVFTERTPLTEEHWRRHLEGKDAGLGIIPLNDDNSTVHFAAIDVDVYPLDHAALEKDVEKLPLTITKSKSGGAHLWLFGKEPLDAALVIQKMHEWAAALGFGSAEVFPKQSSRAADDDVGNWINLPYFGDTRKCVYQGKEVPLDKFLVLAAKRSITQKQLDKIRIIKEDAEFADGAPCLQVIAAAGIQEGRRNSTLINIGVYLKLKYPDDWQSELRKYNSEHIEPAIPEHELKDMIKSLERREYNYQCNNDVLKPHCNRKLCVKRPFGVAQGDDELNIVISGLTKYTTNPPRWFVNVDEVRVELSDTSDLLGQGRFERFCVESVHKVLTPVSPRKWREVIQEQLNKVEVVEAPLEASPEGQFYEYLRRYIDIRGQSESKDALAQGRVWIDEEGWAYFRSTDFFSHLRREGFRDIKQGKMFTLLHDIGMKKGRFNIKGQNVPYWCVKVGTLQDQPFDVPTFQDPFGDKK